MGGIFYIIDIAGKWATSSNNKNLPRGIVTNLKKVTTPDGYLTFERFCAGIKIAMLRHDAESRKANDQNASLVSWPSRKIYNERRSPVSELRRIFLRDGVLV